MCHLKEVQLPFPEMTPIRGWAGEAKVQRCGSRTLTPSCSAQLSRELRDAVMLSYYRGLPMGEPCRLECSRISWSTSGTRADWMSFFSF